MRNIQNNLKKKHYNSMNYYKCHAHLPLRHYCACTEGFGMTQVKFWVKPIFTGFWIFGEIVFLWRYKDVKKKIKQTTTSLIVKYILFLNHIMNCTVFKNRRAFKFLKKNNYIVIEMKNYGNIRIWMQMYGINYLIK